VLEREIENHINGHWSKISLGMYNVCIIFDSTVQKVWVVMFFFFFCCFFKEVSYAHQGCIYLIQIQ